MNALKNGLQHRRNIWCKLDTRLLCTPAASAPEIQIPNRIERGPTDILKALEGTLAKYDATGRGRYYMFMDDPFLTPLSSKHFRMYAMSREAGKQTAMWLHKKHSDLFPKTLSEPEIKKYQPPEPYTEDRVSEEVLSEIILQGNVEDALKVYYMLDEKVSVETKLALFELLCYFNNVEAKGFIDLPLTQWFMFPAKIEKNMWKMYPEIKALFEFLIKQDADIQSKAYSALICGLIKYLNVEHGFSLFETVKEKNLPLDINAYNALLSKVSVVWNGDRNIFNQIQEICTLMNTHGVRPSIRTINIALQQAQRLRSKTNVQQLVNLILKEAKKLNIPLSLGSYYNLLHVYSQRGNESLPEIQNILNSMRGKTFTIQDMNDSKFFTTAMKLALQHGDRNIGEAVHDILLTGDNYQFLSDNFQETVYFRSYMTLILLKTSFRDFFEFYQKFVPFIYIPEPAMMVEILGALQCEPQTAITEYLPKLWSDVIAFNHLDRTMVMIPLLKLSRSDVKLPVDSPIHVTFAENVETFWTQFQTHSSRKIQQVVFQATMLGDAMIILARGGNFSMLMNILNYMIKNIHIIAGKMEYVHIHELFNTLILEGYTTEAITFLEFLEMTEYESLVALCKQLSTTLALTDAQATKLRNLMGDKVLGAIKKFD